METYGRHTIYANYTEKQLLSGTEQDIKNKILDILTNSISLHNANKEESIYLINYLYGIQDIQNKVKTTRTDINNKSVENWAWAFQDWKKSYLLGKPIQYAPINDVSQEEITELNKYVTYEDKHDLDLNLYEDIFTCGRGFRYIIGSNVSEDDEAPFELQNCDVQNTEVVYSSSIGHEQLLSYIETSKKYIVQEINPITNEKEYQERNYEEYTVYLKNMKYVISNKSGQYIFIDSLQEPIIVNNHIIIEYYLNKKRMSLLEIAKDIFNDINYCENLDLDDMVSFVNSIMVFTNAEVDESDIKSIKEFGAVSINSTSDKKASVEILQSRLKSLDTQIYYLRKLSALHSILSVPQANNAGEISNAETGKATLTGQGFTSASVRVEGEEQSFKKYDRNSLKVILKYCKLNSKSLIKNLKITDIETKFNRDLSDNLLTKSQALQTLASANIPPIIRNQVVGLFSDPVSVTRLQEQFEKEKQDIQNKLDTMKGNNNNLNGTNEINNKIQDTLENQNQGN